MKKIQDLKFNQLVEVLNIEHLAKVKGKGTGGNNIIVIWPKS